MPFSVSAPRLALLLLMILPTAPTWANGWEHGAVPLEALVGALDNEAPEIRARAAQSLGYRGQPEGVPPLLALLEAEEPSPAVRSAAAIALGRLEDPAALQALEACLESEPVETVQADCALALGLLGDPGGLAPLLEAYERDEGILLRSRIVDSLGSFREPEAQALLASLLEAPGPLRLRAIRALGRSGAEAALAPLLALLERGDLSQEELRQLVDALGQLGRAEAGEPLLALLERSEDPDLRVRITAALAAIREGALAPALAGLLEEESLPSRYFALEGLRALGDPTTAGPILDAVQPILAEAAETPETELLAASEAWRAELSLVEAGLRALIELDPKAGEPLFLAAVAAPEPPRNSAAGLTLAQAFYELRRLGLYGLGYTGSEAAFEALRGPRGLQAEDARLRAVAVRSLGVLGKPGTAALLLPALEDASAEVRWTAAGVLGRLADPAAVEPLLAALDDSVAEVRRQALEGLAYLGDGRALEPARRLAESDPSAKVRDAAGLAVQLLSD